MTLEAIAAAVEWRGVAGSTLKNGGIVIKAKPGNVLAVRPGCTFQPFATWAHDAFGNTFGGAYFDNLESALADFSTRN